MPLKDFFIGVFPGFQSLKSPAMQTVFACGKDATKITEPKTNRGPNDWITGGGHVCLNSLAVAVPEEDIDLADVFVFTDFDDAIVNSFHRTTI